MSGEREFQRLDVLLGEAFRPDAGNLPAGFEGRVMARIMEARERPGVWEMLLRASRPLFAAGAATAAVLGLIVHNAARAGGDAVLASLVSGDPLARWLAM